MPFTPAGQSEIFRSYQRDDEFSKKLNDRVSHVIQTLAGMPRWIRLRVAIELGSKFLYQLLTTLSGSQTLGEEYTGIIQTNSALDNLPSKQMQVLMVLFNTFGEKGLIMILRRLEIAFSNNTDIRAEARETLIKSTKTLRDLVPVLLRLHKALFFLQGNYYDFPKRSTSIRYALVRFWFKDRTLSSTFRLLGVLTAIQQLYQIFVCIKNPSTDAVLMDSSKYDGTYRQQCSLCLNVRKDTSVTSCGHLFCWNCILAWLTEQPYCPLCRENVEPSRVVYLQNYTNSS